MIKNFNDDLFKFIKKSTCSFTCIKEIKKELLKNGFKEVYENKKWHFKYGKYFVIRNDASIIAFNIGKDNNKQFNIVCAHSDNPGFCLKPNNEIYEYNYLKLNVSPYGGLLNYGWMDKPLSISGRIIYKENNVIKKKIIDLKNNFCVIPSVAIHQNDEANTNLDLNTQIDLIPIISLTDEKEIIKKIINKYFKINNICDYDLFLYSKEKPMYIGSNKEMILSPRLDDLTSTFSCLKSFINSENDKNINMMCIFNSEEIGSLTKEGADSNFLMDTLKKISSSIDIDISIALQKSFIVSADNSHAVHPNHPDKSDVNNKGYLNKGVLIVREPGTTTDSFSSTIFKDICKKANVPFQDFTARNDLSGGGTPSGLCIRHVSIDSIDVGISQLAMHSSNELIGSSDPYYLYKAFKKFYEVSIIHKFNKVKIIEKRKQLFTFLFLMLLIF